MCGWTTECLLKASSPPPSFLDDDDATVSVSFAVRDGLEINDNTEQKEVVILMCYFAFIHFLHKLWEYCPMNLEEVVIARPIRAKTIENLRNSPQLNRLGVVAGCHLTVERPRDTDFFPLCQLVSYDNAFSSCAARCSRQIDIYWRHTVPGSHWEELNNIQNPSG